jgi:hypothetical protein
MIAPRMLWREVPCTMLAYAVATNMARALHMPKQLA